MDTYNLLMKLYQDSPLPVVLVRNDLLITWANKAALDRYPTFSLPDGLILMLPSHASAAIRELVPESVKPLAIPLPISGIAAIFTPFQEHFVVNFEPVGAAGSALHPEGNELLVSSISNQFHAPLSSIFASVSALYQMVDQCDNDHLSSMLQSINQNGYSMLRSASSLTSYVKYCLGEGRREQETVDLSGLLENLCDAAAILTHSISIPLAATVIDPGLVVTGSQKKLTQAVLHVISNSCRYTCEHNYIEVSARRSEDRALITISDHGLGIDPQTAEHVFEPFFSFDHQGRPFAGDGLGLTIVRYIVAQHGGSVALTSRPGQGTTVAITLPLGTDAGLSVKIPPMRADLLRDHFSYLHIVLSDSCGCPTP